MRPDETIVLVGPMGSGKSTVGRNLAYLLDKEFVDSDHELESRCGADIPWIFDIEGEQGFRRRETAVLEDLSSKENVVIATGGGAILEPRNRQILKKTGRVVYLTASLDVLFSRVMKDSTRPLLQVENPRQVYREIFHQREPLYRETAELIVSGDKSLLPMDVAKQIQTKLENT